MDFPVASTAWTANRGDLVRELAKTKAAWRDATERADRLAAHLALAEANRMDATTTLALVREALRRQRLNVPPDPNAKQHRTDLLAALKEKP